MLTSGLPSLELPAPELRSPEAPNFRTPDLSMFRSLLVVVLALAIPTGAASLHESDTLVLSGALTVKDKGTYQEHPFTVPAGVTRIDVEFTYQNKGAGTELEIGVFDPQRFRGTSRFSKDHFHISE